LQEVRYEDMNPYVSSSSSQAGYPSSEASSAGGSNYGARRGYYRNERVSPALPVIPSSPVSAQSPSSPTSAPGMTGRREEFNAMSNSPQGSGNNEANPRIPPRSASFTDGSNRRPSREQLYPSEQNFSELLVDVINECESYLEDLNSEK
jgi:hypothetical protein